MKAIFLKAAPHSFYQISKKSFQQSQREGSVAINLKEHGKLFWEVWQGNVNELWGYSNW